MKRAFAPVLFAGSLALAMATTAGAQTQSETPTYPAEGTFPMPLDGSWTILDEFFNEGDFFSGPWIWNSAMPVRFTCTDLYVVTDQYEIYDNGVLVYTTPSKPDWDDLGYPDPFTAPPYEGDPDLALASGFFCHGSILFGPGAHSIEIRDIHLPPQADGTPFGDGTVAFKAEPQMGNAFALENFPGDDFIQFNPANPAGYSVVNGSTGSAVEALAMDFDATGTTLYGLDYVTLEVGTIDTTTGVWTPTAVVSPPWAGTVSGMSADPTDGTMYVASTDGATSYLYRINPGTGALVAVGSTATDPLRIDIAIDLYGQMYGHDILTDSLYLIDKSNGSATLIGPTGYDCNFAQGLDFDYSTNTLYATLFFTSLNGTLASINVDTGAATLLPGLPDAEYEIAFSEPAVIMDQPGAPYCFGDPGVGTPCPCSNDNDGSIPGSGCDNGAHASGAKLTASGTASIGSDDLVLTANRVEASNTCLFFQANNRINGGMGNAFGDGLRCAGGGLVRLQIRFASAQSDASTTISIATKGGVTPGDVKRYQCWFRTTGNPPCGVGVNDFNLSNGYEIYWMP